MIHAFEHAGRLYALDVESLSVHCLDRLSYDVLKALEEGRDPAALGYAQGDVCDVLGEIEELKREGVLFAPPPDYETPAKPVIKALCLHAAHDCNLRCSYCFGSTGSFHGSRSLMSLDTACRAIDFLIESSGKRQRLEVDFFGGEPLMNFGVVAKTVDYGRKRAKQAGKSIDFTITTNGYGLTSEMIDYIAAEMKNVVISVDGRREIHDAHRKTPDGRGSYDAVIENAQKIAAARGEREHYVRATFTADNLDFTNDVAALDRAGFKNISVEPVVTKGPSALKEEHISAILSEYERLSAYLDEHPHINFFHFDIDLDAGPCVLKRIRGCGAGTEYAAVAPSGDIYPCHQFVGVNSFLMGNVKTGITRPETAQAFSRVNIRAKDECRRCWAKYYCSGGCAANAYNMSGDISGFYPLLCALAKKRLEIAVARAVRPQTAGAAKG